MSLETQIAALVTAANTLTAAVNGKITEINQKVAAATEAVPATVRAEVSKVLYVDAAAGNDAAAGTQGAPLKTIGAAVSKVVTGGVGTIFLRRGQTHEVGFGVNQQLDVQRRAITFFGYGAEVGRPKIKGVPGAASNGTYIVNAFISGNLMNLKFVEIDLLTGDIPDGSSAFGSEYGGFFSRAAESGESVDFRVMFWRCGLEIQDLQLFTTLYGFMAISMVSTTIVKNGVMTKIVSSGVPKILDLVSVSITGFPANSTVETLFSLVGGAYMSRNASGTITNGA